jgi:parallel beta-helix repeat protein
MNMRGKTVNAVLFISVFLFSTIVGMQVPAAASVDGVVLINVDGAVSGTDKILRSGNLYTLIGDLSGSVQNGRCLINVLKDNVVLDGAGYTISGSGTGIAIQLQGKFNVTVKNVVIDNFGDGIDSTYAYQIVNNTSGQSPVVGSGSILVFNNTFRTTYWGVMLRNTNNSIVSENVVTSLNNKYGMKVLSSSNNTLINNRIAGGSYCIEDSSQTAFINNTVNGKLFVYLENASNQVIENVGQVWLVNCNNITVKSVGSNDDLRVTVCLEGTNNSRIMQCSGRISLANSHFNEISANKLSDIGSNVFGVIGAICLSRCDSCLIANNEISAKNGYCIYLEACDNNTIEGNRVSSSESTALVFETSMENRICRNTITDSQCGIDFSYIKFPPSSSANYTSNTNLVYSNNINNCVNGISLKAAYKHIIFENNITASTNQAVSLFWSDNNTFFHNNFINNSHVAYETHITQGGFGPAFYYSNNNTWDNGYPSGGNFWSGYTGLDGNMDGIGDTAYNVFENQTDRYPLMRMYLSNAQTQPIPALAPLPTVTPTTSQAPNTTPTLSSTPSQTKTTSS